MTDKVGRPSGKGSNMQIIQEKRQLEEHIKQLQRELQSRPPRQTTNKRVYASKPITEFNDSTKQSFVECNSEELGNMFNYVDPIVRKQRKGQWNTVYDMAIRSFEDWTIQQTGNRWLVKSVALKKKRVQDGNRLVDFPSEDYIDLEFVHKGYLRYMLNDKGQNVIDADAPPVVDLFMTVRIYRYDIA